MIEFTLVILAEDDFMTKTSLCQIVSRNLAVFTLGRLLNKSSDVSHMDESDFQHEIYSSCCCSQPLHLVPLFVFTVSYYGNSFCRIHAVQDVSSFQLSLQFKTSQRSGLLLLAGGNRDYLAVELKDGRLRVRTNLADPSR